MCKAYYIRYSKNETDKAALRKPLIWKDTHGLVNKLFQNDKYREEGKME